jgi:hypothetical protein
MTSPACPLCGKAADIRYRPFCSRHCADLDLHRWLVGRYAIPAAADADEEASPDASPGPDDD